MATIALLTFAIEARGSAATGCWVQGKEEVLKAVQCILQDDGTTTILTLCDGRQCKTKEKPASQEKPCPDSTKPHQQAKIIKTGSWANLYVTGSGWALPTTDGALAPCSFDKTVSCSMKNEVLFVRADRQSFQRMMAQGKAGDVSAYRYVIATPDLSRSFFSLYSVSDAKWYTGDVLQQEDIPDCE